MSALFGVLALVACVAVVVLTDDDLDLADGTPGGVPGLSGGDGSSTEGRPGTTGAGPGSGTGSSADCTPSECPPTSAPTVGPGDFPFPPGATPPRWTDDFCADTWDGDGYTYRQVRMPVDQVRDWYFAHLADAGYQWGASVGVQANPWRGRGSAKVPLGWSGGLSDKDGSYLGQLDMERELGGQTVCGPPPGHVFIRVTLP